MGAAADAGGEGGGMILTPSQLHALTGRVRPSVQRRTLDHLRIPYRLRPDGSIVV